MKKYSCYYILSESTNLVDVALTFVNGDLSLLFWLLGNETVVERVVGGLDRCFLDNNLLGSSRLLGNTGGCGSLVSERKVGKRVGEGFELGAGGRWDYNFFFLCFFLFRTMHKQKTTPTLQTNKH